MQSWPAVDVPRLPRPAGPPLRLHDTATGRLVETPAAGPGEPARLYVCGITPYDATHLGHAATYLAFDLVQRVWVDRGHPVHYVQNVTDIDDPLLERAARDSVDWVALAEAETAAFREDMAALRVLPPTTFVGAVESIPRVGEVVRGLLDAGAAYDLDGDVYLAVDAAPRFGAVAGLDVPTMTALSAERGGDPERPGKKDPLDSLLWRAERPGEPSWPSPLGPGRPGWHVECAVIALDAVGSGIDLQGGGNDLAYPHHEHSAATGELIAGEEPFAHAYVHAGMIGLDGEKMSKSKGNLVFVRTLRSQGVDPSALRLALLSGHYREDRAWTPEVLVEAEGRLSRWRSAVSQPGGPAAPLLATLRERLADDLDTPGALGAVDDWVARGGVAHEGDVVAVALDGLLGISVL